MSKVKVEYIAIGELKAYARNTRTHSKEQVKQLEASITEFGFTNPVLIDEDNVLIAGHGRTEAARRLGLTDVPAIRLKGLTEAQRNALRIADNSLALNAGWDVEALREELDALKEADFDVSLLGLDSLDIDGLVLEELDEPPELIEDEPPAVEDVETRVQPGDVWVLGAHRLMCGDSTSAEDVERLMDGEKADMVFTDPPYGMKKEAEGVLNDNLNFEDLLEFNKKWIPLSFSSIKETGSWYCWGIDEPLMDIYANILKPMAKRNEITFRNLITWDKGHGQGQRASSWRSYANADEKCLFVMCGVQGFNTNADNYFEGWEPIRVWMCEERRKSGLTTAEINRLCGKQNMTQPAFTKGGFRLIVEADYLVLQKYCAEHGISAFKREYEDIKREYEDIKREYEDIKREYYGTRAYFDNTHDNMNNVWHFERTSGEERSLTGGHATPKPIALCSRAIKSSSREKEMVLDVFGGSGSTLIACEQLNRRCRMMELDPKYCDVILTRWEKLTGKTAFKAS